MYGKIFDSMYEGTLYGHWQAIVTLQQMLVLCNSEGVIDMTPQAMAARTSIPLEILQKGIEILSEPDQYSRTPGDEGRRIILMDDHRPWGWLIVNYAKYRDMKSHEDKLEADRVRIREKRAVAKVASEAASLADVAKCRKVSQPVADVAHVAVAETKEKPLGGKPPVSLLAGFESFWSVWPKSERKQSKGKCLEAWKAKGCEPLAEQILSHVKAMCLSDGWSKDGGQFIPAPLVYLNQARWEGAEVNGHDHEVLAQLRAQYGAGIHLTEDGRSYTDGSRYWKLTGDGRLAI